MRVVITAGGTGGHIYPALAIINKIKKSHPDSEFLYIGTHNRMEKDIIPKHGIPFKSIEIYGFNRKNPFKNIKTVRYFLKSLKDIKKYIKEFKPDIVIGVGGYVTGPVIYMAHKLGYKTFIHEQNSVPGKANRFLSKYADTIGVSFKSSTKYFPSYKTVFTGNPCSEEAVSSKEVDKQKLGLEKQKKCVLFVMGSLGSSKMNDFLIKTMTLFKNKPYQIIFVTGKNYEEELKKHTFPNNVKAVPYIDNMTGFMKNVDMMVSRAGASTLSEIIALQVPSILIPSPYVPENHQYKNAMDLVNKKAALLLEESELKGDILVRKIDELLLDSNKIHEMKKALAGLHIQNSATKIVEEIEILVGR